MSVAKAYSAQLVGLASEIVTIEVDISPGLHAFSIVGLGDRSIDEARDRISAAIKNSGYVSPKQKNQKVVISLAPADLRKEGASFDLAMALAYLAAAGEIAFDPEKKLTMGELSLEGKIRRVNGLLPVLCQASRQGFREAFVPSSNADEASLAEGIAAYAYSSLTDAIDHVSNKRKSAPVPARRLEAGLDDRPEAVDMSAIRGNESAKRGLEIAAAGAHNVLMHGPPGTGKTMLSESFRSILPPLSREQSVEVTGIHSAARLLKGSAITRPPFRSPHPTSSFRSMVGGGALPRPGEITLAHRGVLFLDEFPQFDRAIIEALRQPLEDRIVTISRARWSIAFPAQFILIAAMNPCPCGLGRDRGCTCPAGALEAYRRKISGPIMDRIDIRLEVNSVDYGKLAAPKRAAEPSDTVRKRVAAARLAQAKRFASFALDISYNSEINAGQIEHCVELSADARRSLTRAAETFNLSARGFHRTMKVARTIADLAQENMVTKDHVLEALQYRQKNF